MAARFVLACTNGHLDDFPYVTFVHGGGNCPEVSHPRLRMADFGGNQGANVMIRCVNCPARRNIREAMGGAARTICPPAGVATRTWPLWDNRQNVTVAAVLDAF